jgi:serine/threonine-protein kinase
MSDDPRVEQLLEELLNSGGTPEEACRDSPELLAEVQAGWQRLRALKAEVGAWFPQYPISDDVPPLPTGELPKIRGYEVQEVLGRGGMGVVYKAWHLRLNRTVALKMLLAGPYARPEELERFFREAEAVAGLRHANIVQVHDMGDLDGRPYFTMEYVEGSNLAQKLAGTPQPAGQAAALVATLAEAIHVAHQSGIVHRDLKPANILLQRKEPSSKIQEPSSLTNFESKISDFGLARRLESGRGLTLTGVPVGTPSYMAPEQCQGQWDSIGSATDVYALGAILYELLTGRPPFRAETSAETLRQVVSQDAVPPSRLNARVPRDLETICLKCLEKDPRRRYVSAEALAEDLHRFARNEPIVARPVGPLERALRWTQRHPTGAALVATALALIGLAIGGGAWLMQQRAERRGELRSEVDTAVAQAESLRKRFHFHEARELLQQARQQLELTGPDDLRRQVDQAQADLKLVEDLDTARLRSAIPVEGSSGPAGAELLYAKTLAEAGLSLPEDDSETVAARVRDSAARQEIVAALDDWASMTKDLSRQAWLLAVARGADPHPLRDRLRQPQLWQDVPQLTRLVQELRVDELSPQLLTALGRVLRTTGGEAVPLLSTAQAYYPQDFWLNFELGWALYESRRNEESLGFHRAALALRPEAIPAYNFIAVNLAAIGRADEGIAYLQQALSIDRNNSMVHNNLGLALFHKGRLDEAIGHYEDSIRLDPEGATAAHCNLAVALWSKGQQDEAIRHYQESIRLDPQASAAAHHNLGVAMWSKGRLDEAIGHYQESIRLDPKASAAVHHNFGSALRDKGRLDEAIGHFQEALQLDPNSTGARRYLAMAHAERQDWDKAAGCYQRALERDATDDGHFWFEYAAVLLLSGDRKGYEKACAHMVARYGKTSKLRAYHVARACTLAPNAVADPSLPGGLAEKELQGSAKEFWSLTEQGALAYRAGRFQEAVPLFEQSLKADPMPGRAVLNWLWLALTNQRLGKAEEAHRWLDKATAWLDHYRDGMPARADAEVGLHLHNWLEAHVLRHEAEMMIRPPENR